MGYFTKVDLRGLDDEIVDVRPCEYLAAGAPAAPEPDAELVPGWWD